MSGTLKIVIYPKLTYNNQNGCFPSMEKTKAGNCDECENVVSKHLCDSTSYEITNTTYN